MTGMAEMDNHSELAGSEPEETNAAEVVANDERYKWYAVFTQAGMEKRAKQVLEERIKRFELTDYFKEVLVPVRQVEYIDEHGKKKLREQKVMPGYLLIHMDLSDKTFSCVKDTPKISNFVGGAHSKMPPPMPDSEIAKLLNTAANSAKEQVVAPKMAFEKGERVKVIDGPFTSFVGDVDDVKQDKQKLRLLISVFGRPTPVEIEFSKVEKIRDEKPVEKAKSEKKK